MFLKKARKMPKMPFLRGKMNQIVIFLSADIFFKSDMLNDFHIKN